MVTDKNEMFDKVYNKLANKIDSYVKQLSLARTSGLKIDYDKVKTLNVMIRYLDSVKLSRYTYYYVDKLTMISNYLNTI